MNKNIYFGIDFGTTNTAVVMINKDEKGSKVKLLAEDGKYPFSSIVAIPKDKNSALLFGRTVKKQRLELAQTHDIFSSMKSYLGTDFEFVVGENRYSAIDITTEFLRYVKAHIQKVYNYDITEATFSFPVDFTPQARKALKQASINAGIKPNGFISESTAAYIANISSVKALTNVLVLDWGGGTFDVSVLQATKNKLVELAVWGKQVGGDDIDIELAKIVHTQIVNKSDIKIRFEDMSPNELDHIISACEMAKIDFSTYDEDTIITVQKYGEFGTKNIDLTYETFENLIESIISSKIFTTIETALKRADLTKEKIDSVIVVGGSSNVNAFANSITNIFGEGKIIIPPKTDWSVAIGTGMLDISGTSIKLNSSLGLMMSDNTIYPILKKNEHGIGSKIPSITFALVEDAQEAHFVFVNDEGQPYSKAHIQTKGFMYEDLILNAQITDEQIAEIKIKSVSTGKTYEKEIEINKLTFYYDLEGWNI